MKISKRVREGAALICAIAASSDSVVVDDLGFDFDAVDLFDKVTSHVLATTSLWGEAVHAEAEALLRTGWPP